MSNELRPAFARVDEFVKQWVIDVTDHIDGFEDCYGESDIERVENEHRDGFVAYTGGGWQSRALGSLRYAYASGSVPDTVQPYIERAIDDCAMSWNLNHPEHPIELIFTKLGPEYEDLREQYNNEENEYMEVDGLYHYIARALYHDDKSYLTSAEPQVTFMVGIEIDDEKWLWEKTINATDLTAEMIDGLVAEAKKGLEDA